MEAERPTFIIDLEAPERPMKPVPYDVREKQSRVVLPKHYPKYETEFFATLEDCAKMIDNLATTEEKIEYNTKMNKIFISRDRVLIMRLYRELIRERMERT